MFWFRWTVVCLVSVCVLVSARPVHADEAQAPRVVSENGYKQPYRAESKAKQPTRSWYGYQTLAVDAVALGMILAGLTGGKEYLSLAGLGTYLLGAPLVHLAHGGRSTLRSFGVRLVPPVIFVVGAVSCLVTMGAGCAILVLGVLAIPAVMVVDAANFAWERVEPAQTATARSLVLPYYDPTRRAGMVSWAGTF